MVAQATIRKYYLLLILQRAGMGMTAAVYATFLLSNGLNLLEINLVNMIFFVTLFLCEVPTGALAHEVARGASDAIHCVNIGVFKRAIYRIRPGAPGRQSFSLRQTRVPCLFFFRSSEASFSSRSLARVVGSVPLNICSITYFPRASCSFSGKCPRPLMDTRAL